MIKKTERRISQKISDKDRKAIYTLTNKLRHHINVLFCAVQTIDVNDAIDVDEDASRVRNVLYETERELRAIEMSFDSWHVHAEVRL